MPRLLPKTANSTCGLPLSTSLVRSRRLRAAPTSPSSCSPASPTRGPAGDPAVGRDRTAHPLDPDAGALPDAAVVPPRVYPGSVNLSQLSERGKRASRAARGWLRVRAGAYRYRVPVRFFRRSEASAAEPVPHAGTHNPLHHLKPLDPLSTIVEDDRAAIHVQVFAALHDRDGRTG